MKARFCLLLFLKIIALADARAADVLARRVSLVFHETPLRAALDEVARQAAFEWSYNPAILDEGRRVSLSASGWTVREALRELLGDGYEARPNGNFLILKKQKPPKNELSGTLRDPRTGERLAGATVFDRRTMRSVTTDSGGFYQLKISRRSEIVVAKLGYRDTVLQVKPGEARFLKIDLPEAPPPPENSRDDWRRTARRSATELEMFFSATLDQWRGANVQDTLRRRFQFSFLPKIGTNRGLDAKVTNDWSVNLLAGQSAGVRKLEAAGIGNFTKKRTRGVQLAGAFNFGQGSSGGIEAAGFFNAAVDTLDGAQLAGFINYARRAPKRGVQAAGFVNFLGNNSEMRGVQSAGFVNFSMPNSTLRGAQAAGFINVAGEVRGAQVAGFINHARRVRGVQIGLFNSAREVHGLQIGLLNRSGQRVLPLVNW